MHAGNFEVFNCCIYSSKQANNLQINHQPRVTRGILKIYGNCSSFSLARTN